MVELKTPQINKFLNAPPPNIEAALVFGPDTGLVSERSQLLAMKFAGRVDPPGDIIRIDDEDLAGDPERLAVELQTASMFGDKNVVRIKVSNRLDVDLIGELLDQGNFTNALIVEGGELKRGVKLRKLFEKSKFGVGIPCYPDDNRNLDHLITEEFANSEVQIKPEVREHIIELIGSDRALSRSEIAKLSLYAVGKSQLTIDDVDQVIGDTSSITMDSIASAALEGKLTLSLDQFDRFIASGQPAFLVLNALNRYLMRLYMVAIEMDAGQSLSSAIKKLRPPVHFKHEKVFQNQCRNWSRTRIMSALKLVQETTSRTRKNHQLESVFVERLLMTLGQIKA